MNDSSMDDHMSERPSHIFHCLEGLEITVLLDIHPDVQAVSEVFGVGKRV